MAKKPAVVRAVVSKVVAAAARAAAAVVAAAAVTANQPIPAISQVSHSWLTFFIPAYQNHDAISPMLAAKIAAVVIQPRTFIQNVFTRLPMIRRLLVMSMMSNSNGGVEKPCTIPE